MTSPYGPGDVYALAEILHQTDTDAWRARSSEEQATEILRQLAGRGFTRHGIPAAPATVYILTYGTYEATRIRAVADSRDAAERVILDDVYAVRNDVIPGRRPDHPNIAEHDVLARVAPAPGDDCAPTGGGR